MALLGNGSLASQMAAAFAAGAGVDVGVMKTTLTVMAVSVVLAFAAWLIGAVIENYKDSRLTQQEAVGATVKLFVLVCFLVWVLV